MKKILSLALASAMVVAALPVAYAAENETDHSNGTEITYIGSQEVAAGGAGDVWTVTVPAKMVPGDTGTVKAEGMWAAHKFLAVKSPKTVTLTYGAQTMDVDITFGVASGRPGFTLVGSSTDAVSTSCDITVADASRLFGTWTGILEYDVALFERGDVNQDGVIDQADADLVTQYAASVELSDEQKNQVETYGDINGDGAANGNDAAIISRTIDGQGLPSNVWETLTTE